MTAYLLERAWLRDRFRDDVLVEVEDGRFTSVTTGADPQRAIPVRGLVVPGLANTHSHAFHRALRGRTQRERGTFWTWRDQMYDVAARLAGLGDWPIIPTQAGHDAGILSDAGIPTAMVFVRNPTGVSHSPDEHAETADCLAGVEALADVLAELTRSGNPA